MVDVLPDVIHEMFEGGVIRGMYVGIEAPVQDVTLPHVTVDIIACGKTQQEYMTQHSGADNEGQLPPG